jgi:hypothetical protein
MRSSLLVIFCLISITSGYAQSGYFEDAYRFSLNRPAGTARIMAIGGTQWSLGGDVSNITGNAAGLGFFRSSEASITLGITDWGVETTYLGQNKSYNTSNFAVPNLSAVFAKPKGEFERGAFKGGAFGVSIQRIANFNTEFGFFSDESGETSIIDFYLQDAFGKPTDQLTGLTNLGYITYQVNPVFDNNQIVEGQYLPINGLNFAPLQDENVTQEGTSNQITFSYGGNFNHKLFIGGSLGIRTINFTSNKVYGEFFDDENAPLKNSTLTETLFINGSGVNLNIGLIYKPIDNVNLGFNFQSPTWYALNEEYSAGVFTSFGTDGYIYNPTNNIKETLFEIQETTDVFINRFRLNTPLKIGGGATFFLGKNGFISADVDWVDYSAANLNSDGFDLGPDNFEIQNRYTSTIDLRIGAEYKIDKFRLRGGYARYGDPLANSIYDRSTQQLSGGAGIRIKNFSIDLAVVNQKFNSLYSSYQVFDNQANNFGPVTEVRNNIINGVLTLSLNF